MNIHVSTKKYNFHSLVKMAIIINVNKSNPLSMNSIEQIFSHVFNCCYSYYNDYHNIQYNNNMIINSHHYHHDLFAVSKKILFVVHLLLFFLCTFFPSCFHCYFRRSFVWFSFSTLFSMFVSFIFFISFSIFIFFVYYYRMIDFLLAIILVITSSSCICIVIIKAFCITINNNNKQILHDSNHRYLDSPFSCALSISMSLLLLLLFSLFFCTWTLEFIPVFQLLKLTNNRNVFVIVINIVVYVVVVVEIFQKFFCFNKFHYLDYLQPFHEKTCSFTWSKFRTNFGKFYNL